MHLESYQRQLTDYIRGKCNDKPFANADVYQRLLQKNIISFLHDNRPDLVEVLGGDFDNFVLEFFKNHQCKTPFFYKIIDEFLLFCNSQANKEKK